MNRLTRWFAIKRYRFAVFMHDIHQPIRWGDPALGSTRQERNKNIAVLQAEWHAKGPKPEHYGLPSDTPPTKHLARKLARTPQVG